MKPKSAFLSFLLTSGAFIAAPLARAQSTYYWDDNAATLGFGTAGVSLGTWAAPTAGTVAGWSLSATGANPFASFTTATNDILNFGNGATGLAAGSITVAGTVSAGDMTYASGSGAIVLTGGTINLAATQTITTNAAVGTVNRIVSTLSGAGTSFTKAGVGSLAYTAASTSFNPGSIAITGGHLYIGSNTATQLNGGNYAGDISFASGSTLRVWTTLNQTFSGDISGAGNIDKAYGGTLTLTGLNTYTGKTSVTPQTTAGATLSVSSFDYITSGTYANHGLGSSLGAPTTVANGTISIGSTGKQASCTLSYTGTGETTDRVLQFNLNGTASQTLSANNTAGLLKFTSNILVSGGASGNLNLTGNATGVGEISGAIPTLGSSSGKLVINTSGSWTLSGNNTLTNGVTLTAGKLNVNSATALGATAGTFTLGAGTLDNTSGAAITNANNNPIAWNGDSTFTGTNALNLGTGNVTLGGNRAQVVNGSGALTMGGVVSGAFGITLGGNGRLVLSNEASTYTGKTVVGNNAGSSLTLQVSKLANLSTNSSLGAPTTTATGLIQLGSASNSSTLDYIGTSASSTNRQVQVGSSSNGSGGAIINNNSTDSAHTLTFSNAAFNVAATVTGFNRSLRLGGSNTGDNTISGAIIDNNPGLVSVAKQGDGKWILSGTNTYTGATTVSAGVLAINGSLANTSTTVNGGKLQGSGSTVGSVTVNNTGTFAPGNSIESIATGALTLNAGSTYAYEIDKSAAGTESGDLTVVTGDLVLDLTNAAILTHAELGTSGSWSAGDKLTLIGYSTGTWNGGLFTYLGNVLNDDSSITFSGINWTFNYNDTTFGDNYQSDMAAFTGSARYVTMTAVPEPRAALLGGLGLIMLLRRRR